MDKNCKQATAIWIAIGLLLFGSALRSTAGDLYPFITDMKTIAANGSPPASPLNDLESPNGITNKERVYVNQDDGHFYTVGE